MDCGAMAWKARERDGKGEGRGRRGLLSTFLMIAFKSLPSISFFKFPSSVAVLIILYFY
jgi:hypothetical protein